MPPQSSSAVVDDEYGLEPAKPATGVTDDKYGLEPAKKTASPTPTSAPVTPQPKPNAIQRLSEVTTGFQHPIDELTREAKNIYHNPGSIAGDVSETIGIPRQVWTDPSWKNVSQIGGTGIPGIAFGEHGLLRDPLEFGKTVTGANQAAEDVRNKNYKAIAGDIAGGITNLALLKKPAESAVAAGSNAIENAKQGLADAVRTPENKLTPATRTAARVAGAGAGHATGIPGMEIAGVLGGPALADAALPKRLNLNPGLGFYTPFDEAEQQAQLSGKLGEAEKSRMKELTDQGRIRQIEERETAKQKPSPIGSVPVQPQLQGSNTLSTGAGGPSPEPATVKPMTPPQSMPIVKTKAQLAEEAAPTLGKGTPIVPGGRIVDPNSPIPKVPVTFQSVPRETLVEMVRDPKTPYQDRINAIAELRRSPAGTKLLQDVPGVRFMVEPDAEAQPFRKYDEKGNLAKSGVQVPRSSLAGRPLLLGKPATASTPNIPSLDFEQPIKVPSETPIAPMKPPTANVGTPTEVKPMQKPTVEPERAPEPRRPLPGETPERRKVTRDIVNDMSVEQLERDANKPGVAPEDKARMLRNAADLREMRNEPEEVHVKGLTAVEPKTTVKPMEKPVSIDKKYSQDEITDAEGLIQQEVGMMQSADRPGRYFDESTEGEHTLAGRGRQGIDRMGGSWRGVKSLRPGMPFMNENPQFTPAQLEKALRNKDSAMYRKAMERAIDFIRREKASGTAREVGEHIPGEEEFPPKR